MKCQAALRDLQINPMHALEQREKYVGDQKQINIRNAVSFESKYAETKIKQNASTKHITSTTSRNNFNELINRPTI